MKARSVPTEYAACRAWRHAWDFTTVERKGGEYVQGLRCLRCPTVRFVKINSRTGAREGNRYVYPEDQDVNAAPYKMPKGTGGALTQDELALLTLEEVRAHHRTIGEEMVRRRAARKRKRTS